MSDQAQPYSRLTVKNLKSCMGNEGYAYSATLCLDGKAVAQVRDDGNGGMVFVDFWRSVNGKPVRDERAYAAVMAYVEEQPEVDMGEDPRGGGKWMMKPDLSWVVSQVCEHALARKRLRDMCRGSVCFRVEGQRRGEWHAFRGKYRGQESVWRGMVESYCASKGLRLVEIANEIVEAGR